MRALLPLLVLLCLATASPPAAAAEPAPSPSLPAHRAADPAAPPVTAKNLLASERFWPYHVALTRAWQPPGAPKALPAATRGVLIRVEREGLARVDFGRDGLYAVPVDATDLVAQAERVRRGELLKTAPNFALAIGPRLLEPGATRPQPVSLADTMQKRGFLAVFADPGAEGFPALAKSLAPLSGPSDVATILFPQSERSDAEIAEQLRSQGWGVPFVMGRLSEAYTKTLLPEGTPLPAVTLQSSEGRLLYAARWSEEGLPALKQALAESFSEPAKR